MLLMNPSESEFFPLLSVGVPESCASVMPVLRRCCADFCLLLLSFLCTSIFFSLSGTPVLKKSAHLPMDSQICLEIYDF